MKKIVRGLAALSMVQISLLAAPASAQQPKPRSDIEDAGTPADAGTPDGDNAVCEQKLASATAELKTCNEKLATCAAERDKYQRLYEDCRDGKTDGATKPSDKPKNQAPHWKCSPENVPEAGCREAATKWNKHDVVCDNDRYAAVPQVLWSLKICVLKSDPKAKAEEKRHQALEKAHKNICEGDNPDPICSRLTAVETKIEYVCPEIPDRPGASFPERCDYWRKQGGKVGNGRVNVYFPFDAMAFYRGSGGVGALLAGGVGFLAYFDRHAMWGIETELQAAQFVGGSVNGPVTAVSAYMGPRFDLTSDRRFALHLGIRDYQFFSDHEAGYAGGALKTQGFGNALGGELGLGIQWKYVGLRLRGMLGYGAVNWFPSSTSLGDKPSIQGGVGIGLEFHIPLAER